MLTNRRTVGIRVPDNKICMELVNQLGNPIISAGIVFDDDDLVSDPFRIYDEYKNKIDMVIDGGILEQAFSTIIDLSGGAPEIIRVGKGDISDI
jgi:tRNA A37 threonylcarbamoyladenosine synthetase subunit TsaC/SUA5/YrdC